MTGKSLIKKFALPDDELSRPGTSDRLFFVSERRLGFGARMSSNIAQRFAEAILWLLRRRVDKGSTLLVASAPSSSRCSSTCTPGALPSTARVRRRYGEPSMSLTHPPASSTSSVPAAESQGASSGSQ